MNVPDNIATKRKSISIIVVVDNEKTDIEKVVRSVQSQTLQNWELILVDNVSNLPLSQYQELDSRIKVVECKKKQNICYLKNRGVATATGKYIVVLDPGIYIFSSMLAKVVVFLDTHPSCYALGTKVLVTEKDGNKIEESWSVNNEKDITMELEVHNRLEYSPLVFRNKREFKYRKNMQYASNYDLLLQMVLKSKAIIILPEILATYIKSENFLYDEKLCNQRYTEEAIRYWYHQKKENYKDIYKEIDIKHLSKYASKKLRTEMKLKKYFFEKDFQKARKYAKQLIDIDPSKEWRLYYMDTFLKGTLTRVGQGVRKKI